MREGIGRIGLIGLIAIGLVGCASPREAEFRASICHRKPLDPSARVFVMLARDGWYRNHRYEGSGSATAVALSKAAESRFSGTDVATSEMAEADALKMARLLKANYILSPTILHWEDRATEWSGMPDVIKIEVVAKDVVSGEILDLCDIRAQSGVFSKVGQQPEVLLPPLFGTYLDYLIGRAELPK